MTESKRKEVLEKHQEALEIANRIKQNKMYGDWLSDMYEKEKNEKYNQILGDVTKHNKMLKEIEDDLLNQVKEAMTSNS